MTLKHTPLAFVAALALAGGCASHHAAPYVAYAPQPVRVHYVEHASGATPSTPWARMDGATLDEQASFVGEMERRMDRTAERTRVRVERGELSQAALVELARERSYVDGLLARYSADGKLSRDERIHIQTGVEQMRDVAARPEFRATAIGGGPRTTR